MTSPTTGPIVSWPEGGERIGSCGCGCLTVLSQARPCVAHVLGAVAEAMAGHVLCVSFFFRRWLIHAKCLTMPAMRSAGDRIPFDVQGLFGGSKKPVQKVYFGHHTSSICERQGQAPQATCRGKTSCAGFFPSVSSCADHRISDFTLSWW